MTIPWTPEELSHLKTRWAGDGASASEIARELPGRTRNAVIGAVHRLNLPTRANTPRKPKPSDSRVRRPRIVKPRSKPKLVKTEAAMCCPQYVPVTTLPYHQHTSKHCAYVIGEPKDLTLCGNAKAEDSSYCVYHARICYRPTPPNSKVVPLRREWAA